MCFSAPVSFLAAGATATVGALAWRQASDARDRGLAFFPFTFAIQQAIEGALWLRLGSTGAVSAGPLASGFLVIALLIWPVLSPAAAMLAEPINVRRRIMIASLAVGGVTAAYLAFMMVAHPYEATVRGGCISYQNSIDYAPAIEALYAIAVCAPLLASSRPKVVVFGGLVILGAILSTSVYQQARVSTWCFFAALASLSLLARPIRRVRTRSLRGGET